MTESPRPCYRVAISVLVLLVAGAGCATTREILEKENQALENEISRLKADKANLSARASALEDESLVLEKKASQCVAATRPTLAVVRLEKEPQAEVVEEAPVAEVRGGVRPVLALGPGGTPRSAEGSVSSRQVSQGADNFSFADNLGTTSGLGQGTSAPSDMDRFNEGYRQFANGQFSEALTTLGEFASSAPSHAYADDAVFWRAECYLAMGKQLRAVGEFERLLSRYPSSDKAASALWRIGFAYDRLGDSTQAIAHYFRVVDEFPATEAARKASQRVAVLKGTSAGGRVVPTAAR